MTTPSRPDESTLEGFAASQRARIAWLRAKAHASIDAHFDMILARMDADLKRIDGVVGVDPEDDDWPMS